MGLDYAIDQLYATNFLSDHIAPRVLERAGRPYPAIDAIHAAFEAAGFVLTLTHVQVFGVFTAQWHDATTGEPAGKVVGTTADEAAVFALSLLRRTALTEHPAP